jgi:hypothetical protein
MEDIQRNGHSDDAGTLVGFILFRKVSNSSIDLNNNETQMF